jgi:protein gp37
MELANWHTYQVLTKRSERLRDLLNTKLRFAAAHSHIWWGVSVENRKHGLPRIDHLRQAPAGLRFLSIEPLLEDLGQIDLTDIHWVIVGGESGPGARPMNKDWVLSLRDQCRRANVPFFFKQWGGVQKSRAGRDLDGDGTAYDGIPTISAAPVPAQSHREQLVRMISAPHPSLHQISIDQRHVAVG